MNKNFEKHTKFLALEQDFFSFTVLCFVKKNIETYKIDDKKLAKLLYQSQLMFLFQFILCVCIIKEIMDTQSSYSPQASSMELFFAKFVTSIAMHLCIYREFMKGQSIMKYVMNHEENFHEAYIAFILGFIQLLFCFTFEFINMVILFSKPNVYLTIVSYLTVTLLVDISSIYYQKTVGCNKLDILKEVFDDENLLEITNKTKNVVFSERSLFSKFAKLTYKLFRAVYASLIFYFVPFLYIVFNQNYTVSRVLEMVKQQNQ